MIGVEGESYHLSTLCNLCVHPRTVRLRFTPSVADEGIRAFAALWTRRGEGPLRSRGSLFDRLLVGGHDGGEVDVGFEAEPGFGQGGGGGDDDHGAAGAVAEAQLHVAGGEEDGGGAGAEEAADALEDFAD